MLNMVNGDYVCESPKGSPVSDTNGHSDNHSDTGKNYPQSSVPVCAMTVKLCVDHVPPGGGQVLVKDRDAPIYDVYDAALWTNKSANAFIVEDAPQLPDA